MAAPTPNLICPEDDGEELLLQPQQQQEGEINLCTDDSLLPRFSNLFSSAAAAATATMASAQQSSSNNHCSYHSQCQCSPAKRSFTECQSRSLQPDQEPKAKRQLLLNEHDDSIFALRGYSKIILPFPEKPQPSPEWRCSSSSGLAPPPSSPTLRPLPPLVRTGSHTSSSSVEESVNSCKGFVPYKPTLPSLDRTFSNSSSVISVEGSPNSVKGFSPSPSRPPTAMLPLRPPLRRTVSDPTPAIMTTAQENPNSRRVRRVVDKMKEMSQLYQHMVLEAEEAEEHNSAAPEEADHEDDNKERVSVEEVEDCVGIQFRCPCGKGLFFLVLLVVTFTLQFLPRLFLGTTVNEELFKLVNDPIEEARGPRIISRGV